ncbi:unnamed protein product [Durusdinium trenchii]|uniref:RRM domain-containing protein n=1 Tax=Durusdinium trenchii TaxID=1381693 RepID=A0ABP0M708_9DINO
MVPFAPLALLAICAEALPALPSWNHAHNATENATGLNATNLTQISAANGLRLNGVELLGCQLKVGVAFFEYQDMMTQQQARVALEGLELGNNKLKVLKPDQVIELGLVDREQKLGARVVPSKVVYLKNIVTLEDLADETGYVEICTDIRLEGEKFGAVVSIEAPAPAAPAALPAPTLPDLSMALVPIGGQLAKPGGAGDGPGGGGPSGPVDPTTPGFGYAFIEFANIEGSSKAKKALNGRRFGCAASELRVRSLRCDFPAPLVSSIGCAGPT